MTGSDDNPFVLEDGTLAPVPRPLKRCAITRLQLDVEDALDRDDEPAYETLMATLLGALSDEADGFLQSAIDALRGLALTDVTNGAGSDIQWAHAEAARRLREMLAAAEPTQRRPLTKETRMLVYRRDGYQCVECGEHEIHELSIDHVVAVTAGGDNEPSNLRTLCRRCNSAKGNRL